MRVLYVVQAPDGGGAAHVGLLVAAARERGWEVTISAPGPALQVPAGFPSAPATVPFHDLRAGPRVRAVGRLAKQADVVHIHGPRAASWVLPVLGSRPSIVTFHGLHPLRRPANPLYRFAARRYTEVVCALADVLVCVSEAEVSELASLHVARCKIHHVANAVPARRLLTDQDGKLARRALGLDDSRTTLLFLGSLEAPKDPLFAIRIAGALESEVELLVAGAGSIEAEARAVATPNVRFLGWRRDIDAILAATDVVINTSIWEGLSLSLMQAMWAGRPIVATAAAGNRELLDDTGLVVPRHDETGFVAAIRALTDPATRRRHAAAARARVERLFSVDAMVEQTFSLYDRL